jgi:hypothetical protein
MKWSVLMNSANISDDHACFKDKNYHRLFFGLKTDKLHFFYRFLQHGFFVKTIMEKSVKQMLCDQFGLNPDYVVNRIKTIFYNGKPVDDMETAIVHDGATLALSAAMPGLVGATFRSGGVLSPFRSTISYRPDDCKTPDSGEGAVYIKLFNLLVPEIGPEFLKRGIFLHKPLVDSFLKEQDPDFWRQCRSLLLDNVPTDSSELIQNGIPGSTEFVYLRVADFPD